MLNSETVVCGGTVVVDVPSSVAVETSPRPMLDCEEVRVVCVDDGDSELDVDEELSPVVVSDADSVSWSHSDGIPHAKPEFSASTGEGEGFKSP